jgi:LPXTG-motif cell wall-anchored protein
VKKFLALSLISTLVLSSFTPNLAYATVDQEGEQLEAAQTESTSESSADSAEAQELTEGSLTVGQGAATEGSLTVEQGAATESSLTAGQGTATEDSLTAGQEAVTEDSLTVEQGVITADSLTVKQETATDNQNLSETESSKVEGAKNASAVAAFQEVIFPATIAEIFPDPNLALYMASSNGLNIPINEEITQDVLANWLGNSLEMTGESKDHYFELAPMWGEVESLEGLQYLTNIQEVNFGLSGGNVTTGDFTILEQMPQLTKIKIGADSITDASLAVIAQLPNLKELSLIANITDLTAMNQPGIQIEKLDISHNPVISLEPLQAMTKLKELDCMMSNLTNLTGIESLPLERLNVVMNASLSDISAVANIITLKEINAMWCDIADITPIESLTSLTTVNLAKNRISTIDPVKNLVNLEFLYLGYNQISDTSPLQNLVKLKELSLDDNNISNIEAVKDMTKLTYFGLSQNHVSDISPLKGSANTLEEVYLEQNQILDFSTFQNSTSAVFGTDQEIHIMGKRTVEQIVLTNPARNTDGSILKPVTISDNGTYDAATNQITWINIPVGTEVSYTFDKIIGDLNGWEQRLSGTVYVEGIEDDVPPVITADENISYEVDSTVTAEDFLDGVHAATDDGSLIESDFDQVVDLTTPGDYEVTLTAKDAVGNEAAPVKVIVTVTTVQDTTAPVITADENISYDVNTTVTEEDFLNGVHAATDDGSSIESDFDQVVDLNTPGNYEVTLTAKDAAGNEAVPVKVIVIVSKPIKDPNDDPKPDDVKPVPPDASEEPKDQPNDNSKDKPKNNTNAGSSVSSANQKANNRVNSAGAKSYAASRTSNQNRMLPSTGETSSVMYYSVLLGLSLLAGSFYGFFQKRKITKSKN